MATADVIAGAGIAVVAVAAAAVRRLLLICSFSLLPALGSPVLEPHLQGETRTRIFIFYVSFQASCDLTKNNDNSNK